MGGIALWETLVGTGFGVLLGLPAGAYLNRQSVKYEQRARAATEIRTKLRDIHRALLKWSTPNWTKYSTAESRFEQGAEVHKKLQEFEAYYEAQKPWLEPRTRNAIDGIKKLISDNYIDLMRASASTKLPDTPSDENEAAARVYTWVGGGGMYLHQEFPPGTLPKLLEAFDAEVDKVLGNRPWWQRVVRR